MPTAHPVFSTANPHALERIVRTGDRRTIVAAEPIYDDRGTLLLARHQRVSRELHERLLERKLKEPLEACLRAADGVTTVQLAQALDPMLGGSDALAFAVQPWADLLRHEVVRLPVDPAVQLLLTVAQETLPPGTFEHAVRGMALAGAMQASVDAERSALRLAMLGGLLHDLGDIYVNPAYLHGAALDVLAFRHVATHPRVGELLLTSATRYPAALARAIGEHHERLDGSGYPLRRRGGDISALGALLAAAECALGVGFRGAAPLARIGLALRLVNGEHDMRWVGFFVAASARAREDTAQADGDTEALPALVAALAELEGLAAAAAALAASSDAAARVQDVATELASRALRLVNGLHAAGIWAAADVEPPAGAFELHALCDELRHRRRSLARDCLWRHAGLDESELQQLQPLVAAPDS